jgi:hypothetical protein
MEEELENKTNSSPYFKKGRPKGSKNKPKRGRPKGFKKQQTKKNNNLSNFPKDRINKKATKFSSEDEALNSVLDENNLTDIGYNISTDKIINQEPIDSSYYYRGSKNVPVAGAQYEFTADMIEELKHCKNDIVYFAETFFYIVSIDNGKQKIKLYEAQKNMLKNMVNNRFTVNLASRQSGKSTLLTIFVLWMACFNEDHRSAIVANKESTAINIFKRVRMAYEQLPNYIKPGVKDYGKTGMTLGNDSSILVSTTTATSIRGDSLSTLAIDEVAFIEPHLIEEFWSSVIPSVSSGKKSKILLVSTPNGVGNKFYEIYSGAENGALPSWKPAKINWWDMPGRDEKWKSDQIQLFGSEEKFLQEFGNTFLDDGAAAVGAFVIERFKNEKKDPIWVSEDGEYTVFQYPQKNKLYVVGVDVSEGIGRASSVAQILDVTNLNHIEQVAVYASSRIEPYHFANKLSTIGQSWGIPPILIERNNCGAQVIDALFHNNNYEKIVSYSKISEQDKYNRTRNMGVLSHTNIRFDGIQNMRYWINHLQVVHINDMPTISEFETFVRFPNGTFRKKGDNFYDDRVMALVWALFVLESEICQQYFEIIDYDMQHKPQQIKDNGFWEKFEEFYELKELNKNATLIPRPFNANSDEVILKTLNVTEKDFFETNKYEEDLDDLLAQGYEFI